MPLLFLAFTLIVTPALVTLMLPFTILQRYRAGTARRQARGWVAATNVFFICISVTIFLTTAGLCSPWFPGAFTNSLIGISAGALLGFAGLALTHWEPHGQTLHYTPNRWLILSITLIITARLCFGFWRAWTTWHTTADTQSWIAASGLATSMAAGAVVLGYYTVYWAGVWRRVKRHRRTHGFR